MKRTLSTFLWPISRFSHVAFVLIGLFSFSVFSHVAFECSCHIITDPGDQLGTGVKKFVRLLYDVARSLCEYRALFVLRFCTSIKRRSLHIVPVSHSIAFRSTDDVTIDLLMTSQWPDKCDAITWIVISNSLDIDFHGNIHGRSYKEDVQTINLSYIHSRKFSSTASRPSWHTEAETKRAPFVDLFQIYFLVWKILCVESNGNKNCFYVYLTSQHWFA